MTDHASAIAEPTAPPGQIGWQLERQALDQLGYSAPRPLQDIARANAVLEERQLQTVYVKNPHVGSPTIANLLRDPALLQAVEHLCGTGFSLWRSAFFSKAEGSDEIGWHHDKHFSSGDDDIRLSELGGHYSVLFALTDIVHDTGLLEVIPGTHVPVDGLKRDTRPWHRRPPADHILNDLPDHVRAARRATPIPAGCFMIFHSALLHRSLAHSGQGRRLGLAIRLAGRGLTIPPELATPENIMPFPPPPA